MTPRKSLRKLPRFTSTSVCIIYGTTKSSPPRLSLRSRLGGLLSGPSERAALSASRSRMRLYGHLACAHGPTLLTNPEPCKLVEERIFYALQVRTRSI